MTDLNERFEKLESEIKELKNKVQELEGGSGCDCDCDWTIDEKLKNMKDEIFFYVERDVGQDVTQLLEEVEDIKSVVYKRKKN